MPGLKNLALKSWGQYQKELTPENWQKLKANLNDDKTFRDLLEKSFCLVCVNETEEIIGMCFLVPSGNPTEIYDSSWCYIRFVTVSLDFSGQGIGRKLTEKCIEYAIETGEHIIALHTSEMMHKARYLYESLGFTILKEIEPRLGKKFWLYTRSLT
ncbi:GNAT family N-acetyltransferase [Salmonirosea aquatica]|uniref:GNAT family N-acetyltransferase n=1 Tax=Salmonirosea aquatica TaxID=2654236 RepID=UPI0035713CE0